MEVSLQTARSANVLIIVLKTVYGLNIKPINDPFVQAAEDGLIVSEGLIAGAYLVDAFPICR